MTEEEDEKRRAFVPVTDRKEALTLVREGVKTFATTTLWTKDQKTVVKSNLSAFEESGPNPALYAWVPKDVDPKEFKARLAEQSEQDIYISVSLARANIFFKSRLLGIDAAGFKLSVPEKVFKVQRRKNFRLPIPEGYVVRAEFSEPGSRDKKIHRKVLDVSAGGIAILCEPEDSELLKQGEHIRDLTFKLRNRTIMVESEVRYARVFPMTDRQQGLKIGLMFTAIRPGDAQFIAAYVFEESRKYFTKFM